MMIMIERRRRSRRARRIKSSKKQRKRKIGMRMLKIPDRSY